MPPLELPSPKLPVAPPSGDEPRSRRPARARAATAGAAESSAQIDIAWSETAEQTLKFYAREKALQCESRMNIISGKGIHNAEQGAKRAYNLVARQAINFALQNARRLYPALDSHLDAMTVPIQWQLDLQWLDDAEIQAINRETRGKDKPTDVLSFPVWEGETFPMPPDQDAVMLGDLVISIETAIRQAAELKHDLRAEVAFLAVHGTLHLLGYDHATDAQRRKMFALQDAIVARVREDKGF